MRKSPSQTGLQIIALVLWHGWLPAGGAEKTPPLRQVTIRAEVPAETGPIFLTGNRPELGPWHPGQFAMTGTGVTRVAALRLPEGTTLEFKITLGSWEREALDAVGRVPPNHRLVVTGEHQVSVKISAFKRPLLDYVENWRESGVLGRLEYWTNVVSKHLDLPRHVSIWLPPGYDTNTAVRYPVVYFHDGQNLFDPRLASTGVDWGVDEAIVRGMNSGTLPPLIAVGVWCTSQRGREYSPWDRGPDYARFLIEELMPRVNATFRTRTGPTNTAVMGSSLGGLISFYLCWKHPEVFGRGGCLSTHFPYSRANLVFFRAPGQSVPGESTVPLMDQEIAAGATFPRGARMYFDYGTRGPDANYEAVTDRVRAWLIQQGLREGNDFLIRKYENAEHNEAAWRARLDEPLTFLFGRSP
jgi:pimeloyl-ACP methyl ester carboxylesterase